MNIAMRVCALAILLFGTVTSAAERNGDGSITVQGTIISAPPPPTTPAPANQAKPDDNGKQGQNPAGKETLLFKTLAGEVLSFSEPTPIPEAKAIVEAKKKAAEKAANELASANDAKRDADKKVNPGGATPTQADVKAANDAAADVLEKTKAQQTAADELKAANEAEQNALKNAGLLYIPLGLKDGDLVEVSYKTEPHPLRTYAVRNRLTQPVRIVGGTLTGTITEISTDKTWMVVRTQYPKEEAYKEANVSIQTPPTLQPVVAEMRPGDGVNATYIERDNNIRTVQTIEWQSKAVDIWHRWLALIGGALFLYLLAYAFSRKPSALIVGADDRYSTSKFQTILWFWLVISAYIAIVAHRLITSNWTYIGGVDIPVNLLALSGLSVFTFTAAKFITVGRVDRAAEMGHDVKSKSLVGPKIGDLIRNDNDELDLGDFQMLVITFLAVVVYAFSVVEFMDSIEFRRKVTMPDLDATLLAIFGLGQLAYLGKKVAGEGLSPAEIEYVTKTATTAAGSAKTEADKAEKAADVAAGKAKEAQTASEATGRAANKAAAEPEATKAANAAKDARTAAQQAATAASAAEQTATEANKLVTDWNRHPDIAGVTRTAGNAQADAIRARSAATKADQEATKAESSASTARQAADAKPA